MRLTRGGRTKDRTEPERRCIATGDSQPKAGLIRFVVGPDARIVPDVMGKLPGRGIWVAADRGALDKAVAKKLFARSAKQAVEVPEGLLAQVERQLARRVIDGIALARKAGQAIAGYEKVKTWLDRGDAAVLIQAIDGSGRGKSKLSTPQNGRYIGWLTADELGLAFGRDHVIHSALAPGRLSQRVVEDATRLKGVRDGNGGTDHRKGTKT